MNRLKMDIQQAIIGIEDARLQLRGDPQAGIGHAEQEVRPGCGLRMLGE